MNRSKANPALCAITGATGYVGGRIQRHLDQTGWETISGSRRPAPGIRHMNFKLGEPVDPRRLEGVGALVHCAYDFSPRGWDDIRAVNVAGSRRLFDAAREAGVERLVFISSLSAFDGCRSLYGRAKLEIEQWARTAGAVIIRPGLVYGPRPGGLFGGLVRQVRRGRVIPVVGGGQQRQYLVHEEDLGRCVEQALTVGIEPGIGPITLAHEHGWTLRELLSALAGALGRRPRFVPVPWRFVWLILKALETAGLPAPFRSDSLIGMVYQNPAPSFDTARRVGMVCRPFQVTDVILE